MTGQSVTTIDDAAINQAPVDYGERPRCRTDEDASMTCRARPLWVVTTTDRQGASFDDHLCGRHLSGFLMAMLGHGQSATVEADYGYGDRPCSVAE